jgi:hypothetical protein
MDEVLTFENVNQSYMERLWQAVLKSTFEGML